MAATALDVEVDDGLGRLSEWVRGGGIEEIVPDQEATSLASAVGTAADEEQHLDAEALALEDVTGTDTREIGKEDKLVGVNKVNACGALRQKG